MLEVTKSTTYSEYIYALGLMQNQKFEQALKHARIVYLSAPNDEVGRTQMVVCLSIYADTLARQGRMLDAATYFEQALVIDPDSAPVRGQLTMVVQNLGIGAAQQRQPEEAVKWFRRAVELEPMNPAAYYNLGSALVDSGQTEEGTRCFRKVLELEPGNMRARARLDLIEKSAAR